MLKKYYVKIISFVLVLSIIQYPSIPAAEPQDKLAAYSRFQKYFEARDESGRQKNDLIPPESFTTAIPAFINAMDELNRVVNANKADSDINAIIGQHNARLGESAGLSLGNIRERTINTGKATKTFKSITLTFRNGQKRDVVFINKEREPEVLVALGITKDEDKRYLEVPGVEGLWITKEDTIDIAAGGEVVSLGTSGEMPEAISGIFNSILSDIRQMLTSDQIRILLTQDDSSPEIQLVRRQIQRRLCEIETAIRWTIACYLEPEIVCRGIGPVALLHGQSIGVDTARLKGRTDYYANPSSCFQPRKTRLTQEGVRLIDRGLDNLVRGFLGGNEQVRLLIGTLAGELTDRRGGYNIQYRGMDTRMYVSSEAIRITELSQLFSGRGGLSEHVIDRLRSEEANRIIRVAPNDRIEERRQNILGRITALASICGFGDVKLVQAEKDIRERVVAVRLTKQTPQVVTVGPKVIRVRRYAVNENQLVYYPGALERMVTLARIFDDDTVETRDWATDNSFVTTLLRNLVTAEAARLVHAKEFLDGLDIEVEDSEAEKRAARRVSLVSYLAMITASGKLPCKISKLDEARVTALAGEGQLKDNWVGILAQYIWFSYIFSDNYDNLYQTFRYTEEEVTRRVTEVLNEQLSDVAPEGLRTLARLIAAGVWGIHSQFVAVAKDKIRSAFGVEDGEHFDIAAGGERADEGGAVPAVTPAPQLQVIEQAEQIVIDWTWGILGYRTNPGTGVLEQVGIALSLDVLPDELQQFVRDNKLRVVLSSQIRGTDNWSGSVIDALSGMRSDLLRYGATKFSTEPDGTQVYVLFNGVEDSTGRLESMRTLAEMTSALETKLNEVQDKQMGFIDLDPGFFQIADETFQNALYRRVQQLVSEGHIVRTIGGVMVTPSSDLQRSIIELMQRSQRRGADQGVTPTNKNTVALAARGTQVATGITTIRLDFNETTLPQLMPAISIARAIISVGGEQNVTGVLLEDIKNLYLNMVPQELQDEVRRATSISKLLAIILPPISVEDLRIYEYLLIGKKVAEIAA